MKFIYKFLFIFCMLFSFDLCSQQANNWYFGNNVGLSFNTIPPAILNNGLTNNPDNSSSISDINGNLLFYTDGMTVWSSNHSVMANGYGLIGNSSGGQCALIVPIPCTSKYVIFHVTEFSSPGSLHYTIVDMALNSGLGAVLPLQKNVSLGTSWTEKLCAIHNPHDNSYWLLTHKWGNNEFVAFKVNSTTIALQSVVSAIGSVHSCGSYGAAHDAMGQLTISRDGTKVVNALTCLDQFELFNFNIATGVLSNSIVLPGKFNRAWGTAFSPDSKMLYTNSIFGQNIFQYDLSVYTAPAILASENSVISVGTGGYNFGYMELGPNNKLYIARPGNNSLSVVNNPNNLGALCNPSLIGQNIGMNTSTHGLSRIAYNISIVSGTVGNLTVVTSTGNYTICSGQSLSLLASGASSYSWSTGSTSSLITVSPTVTTNFSLTTYSGCAGISNQTVVTVQVLDTPKLTVSGNQTLCTRTTITLTATGADTYQWSNGVNGPLNIVQPLTSTTFTVMGTNIVTGCTSSSVIQVNVSSTPTVVVSGPTLVCAGSSVNYFASGAQTYTWTSGINGAVYTISPFSTANYTVTGFNPFGCSASTTFSVTVDECLSVKNKSFEEALFIRPNPVDDVLNLSALNISNSETIQIRIYNSTGLLVNYFEIAPQNQALAIDMTEMSPGLYFIKVSFTNKVYFSKFIKN